MTTHLKLLRIATIAYLSIAAILWCIAFKSVFLSGFEGETAVDRIGNFANSIYYLSVAILAIIIVLRAKHSVGNLLFAFLMTSNSLFPVLSNVFAGIALEIASGINNVLFLTLLLKTFQFFPKAITKADIIGKRQWKLFHPVLRAAHSRKSWFIFPAIVLAASFAAFELYLFILQLLVIIAYLYINLSKSESDRNKVLWFFWGLDIYFVCLILDLLFMAFNHGENHALTGIFSIISVSALLLAYTMSFFFFDTFDTGVIVKKTIINSLMLIFIIFVYNVIEHYFLHWVSHQLHLSDALVSSVLSGILVMVFSPMHHKLMHYFEKKFKGRQQHNRDNPE